MKNSYYEILDYYVPVVKCELDYNKDYELLIATVLSAQCTDARVNKVTKILFANYDLKAIASLDQIKIANIIHSCGSYTKKSRYIKEIAQSLLLSYDGFVPNNREYLESLPGVGRKTCNVVLKNLFNVPCIPVDTHVERVSKRLGLVSLSSNPSQVELSLNKLIPKDKWNRVGEQLLLFGRYHCKSKNPLCKDCLFKNDCNYESKEK